MTLRELREMVEEAIKEDPSNLDCEVVIPKETDIAGLFGFQETCPGISGMITVGPSPEYMDDARKEGKDQEMRCFLIAPHAMHDKDVHEEQRQKLSN